MPRRKFLALWESTLTRYTNGGFLAGDLVTFKPGYAKHPHFEGQEGLIQAIKGIIDSGCNIRVANIKNKYPAAKSGSNTDFRGGEVFIDVAPETAPGRFGDSITVCPDILEVHETVPNLSPIPDSFKRKDKITIKPEEVKDEEDAEVPFYQAGRTRTTDQGNGKDTKSQTSLPKQNTKIPSSPAEGHKDPASYTANYLPKK